MPSGPLRPWGETVHNALCAKQPANTLMRPLDHPCRTAPRSSRRRRLLGSLFASGAVWALTGVGARAQTPASPQTQATTRSALRQRVAQATRLSILTDRITRSQVQRALGVLAPRALRIHNESLAEARQILAALQGDSSSATNTRSLLDTASQQVTTFLRDSESLPINDRAALARLAEQADEAGASVDNLVAAYVQAMETPTAAILQTTADLQRLTQHLAVHYLMARAGVSPAEQMQEVIEGRQAFESALATLKRSALRNPRIDAAMPLLEGQWTFLRMALNNTATDSTALQTVSTTSERTLEVLSDLYALYESALRQSA